MTVSDSDARSNDASKARSGSNGADDVGSEAVGYKRPPREHQFKPKTSGNPKGRPRGRTSFSTDVRDILSARIQVNENGRKTQVPVSRALLMRLRQQALAGDIKAIDRLLALAAVHLPAERQVLSDVDAGHDAEILEQWRQKQGGGQDNDDG